MDKDTFNTTKFTLRIYVRMFIQLFAQRMSSLVKFHQELAKSGAKKRERVTSEAEESTPKPSKKLMKSAEKPQKTEAPPPETFKPFDYSQSDLKVFAGMYIAVVCTINIFLHIQ